MTEVQSAAECMAQVQEAAGNIRTLLSLLDGKAQETVDTEDAYRKAFNRAIVAHKEERSIDLRKSMAEIDAESERLAFEQAKATEKRIKEGLHSWRSILSALQTVTTGYREEARFARTGPNY